MAVQHNALNAWGRRPTIMAAAASHPMISALDTERSGAADGTDAGSNFHHENRLYWMASVALI